MDIYNSNGVKLEYSEVLANLPITESCEHVEELMKADHIVLSWRDSEKYTLPVGAYITYKGVNYALLEPYEPEQKSGDEFEYTPNFQHPKMYLGKVPFRFPTTDTEGNSITLLEWPYSGDIDTLLTFFCRTMESVLGLVVNTFNYSILGEIDAVVSTNFNSVDILSALSNVANVLKCEWHIDWDYKILYFGHIKLSRDEVNETVLEVGVNVGTPSVRSSKEGFYNTYEPQGSTRNISKRAASGEYVQGDIRLALNEEDYPDKVIYTNESGTVIASLPQGVKKYVKPLIFDNIYPKLDLYVYDVRCRERDLLDDNGEKIIDHYNGSTPVYKRYAIWYMRLAYPTKVDGHVTAWTDYTINPETDIISGKNLGGAFQPNNYNGAESFPLAGRGNADDGGYGFELNYHTTAETIPASGDDTGVIIKAGDYEIVFQQQNDYILPTTASQGIIPKGVKVNGQEVTDLNGLTNLDDGQKGNIVDLYNIVIGSAYTESAQDELANETLKYITNQFKDNNSYTLKSDVVAFKKRIDQDELLHTDSSLYIGEKVIYKNGDYELETRVMKLVTKLDYAFVQEITVGNEVLKGSTTTLKEQVQTILSGGVGNGSGGGGIDAGAVRKIVQAYANPRFLSKLNDDTAQGFITMLKGLQVGANFVPDILGEGGCLRMRQDGKVELVTDILYARMRAYFDSVVIREYRHESGNRIKSPAQGFNASRVENIKVVDNVETIVDDASEADFFRCYWRVDDGEKKAENQFVVGDLAFCEHSDVVNGSLVTKRYWRVVTGRNAGNTTTADGEAWIDLSNAHDANGNPVMTTISWEGQGGATQTLSVKSFESSANSYPEAHDDICMLGCTTDTTRQGAIIEYVSGVDAPTYQIYQGLGADATNPYSLSGKNQISFGYNSSTGKAYMNVYGDTYIGDKNRSTFLEYKQDDGTPQHKPVFNIKAKVQILPNGSTINGQSIPDYIKDNQNNYDDTEVKADIALLDATTQDLQKQIDGAIETYYMVGEPALNLPPVVSTEEHPYDKPWLDGTETPEERTKILNNHIGDLYYDKATNHGYRFMYDNEEEVYLWTVLTDEDVTEALRIASEAQETADGKRTTYSVWGAWMKNNVNTLEVGDLFIPAANTTQGGVTYKANKVYKCTTDGSATFQAADYIDDAQAQAKIDAFVSNTYNPDKINLQSQIDGKAETFRQATDPSLSWDNADKPKHVGDLWMDISADGGKKTYIYEDKGESEDPRYDWEAQEVPEEVFDEIDGKSTIFGNAIATPPTDYKKDDMWLLPAAATINGVSYKAGEVLSASQDSKTYSAAHWSKKIRYTDDTAFNGYIDAFLNGSSQSGDSFTAAAIQKAITSALGSALGSATLVDGGLMLTSLIGMRQLNDGGDPSQISDYTTWAGISGQYVARDAADPQNPTATWAKGHGIAAWYGGDMVDKEMLSQAQIDAGWGSGEGQYRWAKSVDRFDGSGYRANGNITWNANGELAISDITSIQPSGSNTNVLNDMIRFSNAFHFNTVQGGSTILNIVPQYPFYSLYLYDTSQPNNRSHVASQKWVDDNYVTKAFFRQLFRAFKPNATAGQDDVEIQPNTIDATISNIKAMVDFWSQGGITALGRGSGGGGGGGATTLYGLNDVTPNATGDGVMGAQDGYVLTYNGTTNHWYAAATAETYVLPTATANALGGIKIGYSGTGKNYPIVLDANGKAYVNVPWTDTTYTLAGLMGSSAIGGATQPVYWNGSAFANTTYTLGKSVPSDAVFTDTTYTNGTGLALSSGTFSINSTYQTYISNGNTAYSYFTNGVANKADCLYRGTTSLTTQDALNGFIEADKLKYGHWNSFTPTGLYSNGTIISGGWTSTNYGFQLAIDDDVTYKMHLRQKDATTGWSDWKQIPMGDGTGASGTWGISITGSAATLTTSRTLWGQSFNGSANVSGNMTGVGNITMAATNGTYIQLGDIRIVYDSTNTALKVVKSDGTTAANFYATGSVSALGQGSDSGGGGQGDVTWSALASAATGDRTIHSSYISSTLANYLPLSGSNSMNGFIGWGDNWRNIENGWNIRDNGIGVLSSSRETNIAGAPYSYAVGLHVGGAYWFQISFDRGSNRLNYRGGNSVTTWGWYHLIDSNNIGNQSVNYAASAGSVAWGNVSSKPTTLSGYGITDGLYTTQVAEAQDNVTWAKGYGDTHRRSFVYNTLGTEYSYLFGLSTDSWHGAILKMGYADRYLRLLRVQGGTWKSDDWEKIYAGYADSAGSATKDSDGNTINTTYLKLSGGTMTGNIITGGNAIIFTDTTTSNWNVGSNSGLKILNTAGVSATGAPSSYAIGLSVSGYYRFQLAANGSGGSLMYRNGKRSEYDNWVTLIDSSTIGSQSVNYASSAGSVAWTGISSVIQGGNEVNFINSGYTNTTTWFNFFPRNQRSANSTLLTEFKFGNLGGGFASLRASGFIKDGSSSSYVLTGDGGHAAISGLNVSYAATAGSAPASDVYSWAKASTKPSYNFGEIGAGAAIIGDAANYLLLRSNDSWKTGMYYESSGDEALVFGCKNNRTSFIFANTDPSARGAWAGLTPYMQLKKGCVYINKLIENGTNPSYNLYVNGSAYVYGGESIFGGNGVQTPIKITRAYNDSVNFTIGSAGASGTNAALDMRISNGGSGGGSTVYIDLINSGGGVSISPKLSVGGTTYVSGQVGIGTAVDTNYYLKVSGNTYLNGNVGIGTAPSYKLHVSGDIYATGGVTCASDARMKDVVGNTDLNVEQVANAPAVRFLWKKDHSLGEQVGTLAQYWQNVLPQSVSDKSGELSLQYGVAALVAAITTARKVVDHEKEIAQLKNRVKALEDENEMLKTKLIA